MELFVNSGFVYEKVGDEFLVLDAEGDSVIRVEGDEAVVLDLIIDGQEVDDLLSASLQRLLELGVVTESKRGISRRMALGFGATAVASGFAVLAMPSAAYAASACVFTLTGQFDAGGGGNLIVCFNISANSCGYDTLEVRRFESGVGTPLSPAEEGGASISGTGPGFANFVYTGLPPSGVQARGTKEGGGASEWVDLVDLGGS